MKTATVGDTTYEFPDEWSDDQIVNHLSQKTAKTPSPATATVVPEWGRKNPNLYGVVGAARETLGPVTEALGMGGGGLLGASTGPWGAIGGAGLGYGLARQGISQIDQMLGNIPYKSLTQAAGQAAADIPTGAMMEAGGQVAGRGLESGFNKIFGRKITPEIQHNINLSEESGVPLTPADITQKKGLALLQSMTEKNIASANIAHANDVQKLQALQNYATKVQSGIGPTRDAFTAGQIAKESGISNKNAWMSQAQKLYDAVPIEATTPIETNALRDVAIGHLDELGKMGNPAIKRILNIAEQSVKPEIQYRPGTPSTEIALGGKVGKSYLQKRGLGNVVDESGAIIPATTRPMGGFRPDITASPAGTGGIVDAQGNPLVGANMPTYTWKELTADRAALNKAIRTTSDPNSKRIYYDLVNAIDDDISSFSGKFSPEVKTAFDKATSFYKEGAKVFRDRQIDNFLHTTSPEDVIDKFIKAKPNVSDIWRLKNAIGDDGMKAIKSAWLEKLMTTGENQSFSPAKFVTALNRMDKANLEMMFSKEEIMGLKKLSDISKLSQAAERMAGNPSGTAQNAITYATLWNWARHPVISTALTFGSNRFAKAYFNNPSFRKTLIYGMQLKPGTKAATDAATKLTLMMDRPENEQEERK